MVEILKINEFEQIDKIENNKDIKQVLKNISEFWDVHCCVIVKDEIPMGVGLSGSPYEAKLKAIDCNPIGAIGGTVGFSKEIDITTAKSLMKMDFETILASEVHKDARKYLEKSKSRVFELGFRLDLYKKFLNENESQDLTPKGFKVVTKLKPTQEQVEDMVFAWKVLKSIKKDAIIIAKDFKTRAIELGKGIQDIERAMDNACDGSKEGVLAISTNIIDSKQLHPAIQGRITAIIEPKNLNGSDKEVIKTAEKYGITVIAVGAEE